MMGSQQPFPLSKLIFMFVKSLAQPLSRRLLQRAKTDTLFRRLIVLPPAHLYHFYEAKIKFRVMNLGKVRMAAVPKLGERQAEELGASLAAEFMFYAVASAVLANEILKHKERELEEEELLEQERLEMLEQVSRLLGAMDKRDEVVEELEAVVKLYREKMVEEKAVEDSVEELYGEGIKLFKEETEEGSETFVDLYTKSTRLGEKETVAEELESVVNLYKERNEVSNLYGENMKLMEKDEAGASKMEKCPQNF